MPIRHNLDRLVTTAGRVGAKVVLVGDPAQIGVVRGPGGMLAALANAGHGIDLYTVHRFDNSWEADATLGLRRGDPDVLGAYLDHDRLHSHLDVESAVEALHERWTVERAAGWRVLMMARTRADVDALNARARTSAQDAGEVHGPAVRLGERDWQAGDVLRARRNDRTLPVGEQGYVRNGDRYRVVAVGAAGLHVEHLDRGETAFLPADYVAVHGEYGWATTVTAAQGATVDVGLVLVRPGIDREHLYVAMTRGREANHAFVATGDFGESDRHGPPRDTASRDEAVDVLAAALARSGAQDAAHTARDNSRTRTVEAARHAAEQAGRKAAEPVVPDEHVARATELSRRQVERDQLVGEQQQHRRAAADGRDELAKTTRLRPGRRRELVETIAGHDRALHASFPLAAELSGQIDALCRQVALDDRTREADRRTRTWRPVRVASDEPELAPARRRGAELLAARASAVSGSRRALEEPRAAEIRRHRTPDQSHGRGRNDGPGLDL